MRADGRQAQRWTAPLLVRPAMHETMVQTKVQSRVQTSQSAPRPSAWARPSFHIAFHNPRTAPTSKRTATKNPNFRNENF